MRQLGGAALHLAAAVGDDLPGLPDALRLPALDWSLLHHAPEPWAAFTIHYDDTGTVTAVDTPPGTSLPTSTSDPPTP